MYPYTINILLKMIELMQNDSANRFNTITGWSIGIFPSISGIYKKRLATLAVYEDDRINQETGYINRLLTGQIEFSVIEQTKPIFDEDNIAISEGYSVVTSLVNDFIKFFVTNPNTDLNAHTFTEGIVRHIHISDSYLYELGNQETNYKHSGIVPFMIEITLNK